MKKRKKIRRPVTLIEIMIVIFLIGLIGGVLAINFKGSLDEGKVFKTKEGIDQIHNILMLDISQGKAPDEAVQEWKEIIHTSNLVGRPDDLIKDGWGQEYDVSWSSEKDDIVVHSQNYDNYLSKKSKR